MVLCFVFFWACAHRREKEKEQVALKKREREREKREEKKLINEKSVLFFPCVYLSFDCVFFCKIKKIASFFRRNEAEKEEKNGVSQSAVPRSNERKRE